MPSSKDQYLSGPFDPFSDDQEQHPSSTKTATTSTTTSYPFSNPSSGERDDAAASAKTPEKSFSSVRAAAPKSPHIRNTRSSPRHHHHHDASKQPTVRECVCGRGVACVGMTQAFRLLGDPRSYYVEMPRYRQDAPAYKYVFRNKLREAYIRHLARQHPGNFRPQEFQDPAGAAKRRFVALHHFHPAVVRAFYENPLTSAQKHKVPISITEHELRELGMEVYEDDQILSVSGMPTGGYYFVPNYPHESAHQDLKTLIHAVRASRKSRRGGLGTDMSGSNANEEVPTNIEITAVTVPQTKEAERYVPTTTDEEEEQPHVAETKEGKSTKEKNVNANDDSGGQTSHSARADVSKEQIQAVDFGPPVETFSEVEFEDLWANPPDNRVESDLFRNTIPEEENEDHHTDDDDDDLVGTPSQESAATPTRLSLASKRSSDRDRPWATPKYRRDRETESASKISGPADYIDPTASGALQNKLAEAPKVDDAGEDVARIAAEMTVPPPPPQATSTSRPSASPGMIQRKKEDPAGTTPNDGHYVSKPKRRFDFVEEDAFSVGSGDSGTSSTMLLNHQMPGADPTLRIQVHNDLIAWESKRRSDLAQHLEYNRERWKAASDILKDGMAEAQYAERLILGISKASKLFADSLQAVYDDKLLDDRGNAVKNSFLQNRLAKQRSQFEYSIENVSEDAAHARHSMLLDSIVEAQLEIANAFVENTTHMEQEILPEIAELKATILRESRGLESAGEAIIQELKRSEIEVKSIWDVFDAMVTGDLMEYTVHGSTHGGSSHGGSFHSTSLTGGSGSIHGFLTPGGENEAPIVSSVHSPLVKSTFKQLGGVEDGWLIEMYYKSAVAYQRSVFGVAEMELRNLFMEISVLEEKRFRKLHQLMLAFAPRQKRLFNLLPEHLKSVLENLVGLRIDEESLQKVLDESVKDRSRDHLKGSTAHKSSILNRSRINAQPDSAENEIEDMEKNFGSPFASPMILLSKVVELKPTGLKGLVNTAWKPALAVVTSEGNILVFETAEISNTPTAAFKSLYPPMNFDNPNTWVSGRKAEIIKSLTPTVSLNLTRSNVVIPQMRKSQLEITEEKQQVAGTAKSRFLNAVKSTAQLNKCTTVRVPTAHDATEWANLLERTKKVLSSQAGGKGSRFRFGGK